MTTTATDSREAVQALVEAFSTPLPAMATAKFRGRLLFVTADEAEASALARDAAPRPALVDQHESGVWRVWTLRSDR